MNSPTRILVADDHLVARVGVRAIIEMQPDMTVVAEASDGLEATALFREYLPDVAVMDLRMPGIEGAEAAQIISSEYPLAKMIALTTYCGEQDIRRALAAGMQGYVTKSGSLTELLEAIRAVREGRLYLPESLTSILASQPATEDLSVRELQVLRLLAQGRSNKEIAHVLDIADHTAKNHVKNVLDKLCVGDRTEAVMAAIRRGIIRA